MQSRANLEGPGPTSSRPGPKPGRVLVVDDQLFERYRIGHLIDSGTGMEVLHAANGAEALEVLGRDRVDVVLSDLWMPEMDGLALVEAVREGHPGVPVILMTAEGTERLAVEALHAGASQYVPKHDLSNQLVSSISRVIQLAQAERRRSTLSRSLERRTSRYRIGNEPELFSALVDQLVDDLAMMGLGDPTGRMRVGVALHEALSNAMYHGNLELSSDLRQEDGERAFYDLAARRVAESPYRERGIVVDAIVVGTEATYKVRDEGPGFDATGSAREIEPEDLLRVGGRGLLLIRAFMDDVRHNPTGNTIRMSKTFARR